MKRKWLCALLLCLLPALARADAPDDAMRLVVYTAHKEEVYQPIVEEFERRTGVWVQVVSGGTTELLERIAAEAEAPVADVMFGGGVESLLAYEDYFAPCDAPRAAMLESCRFEAHRFVAFSRLPLVIIYNPRLVSSPPAGFADLLESRLRGRIAFANPGVSGSSFTVLATLIQALGDEDALGRFADNVRGHELSGSGEVVSAVAAGEMRVGVTLYETAKKRMLAGEHIAVVWPKEGTSAVPDGAAIVAGCAHGENAQAFLSFILSEDVQRRVETVYARESVLTALGTGDSAPAFELCDYDIDWAAAHQREILNAGRRLWRRMRREGRTKHALSDAHFSDGDLRGACADHPVLCAAAPDDGFHQRKAAGGNGAGAARRNDPAAYGDVFRHGAGA